MRWRPLPAFKRDFQRLPLEHRRLFEDALRNHFVPALKAGALAGKPRWPARLRVHRLQHTPIYSLTWSFTSPDGRATFHLAKTDDGEPVLVWRRIGNHDIYEKP